MARSLTFLASTAVAVLLWTLPGAVLAFELPSLGVAEGRDQAGKTVAYIEWNQPDGAQDYGYVITKEVNGQEQVLVELKPAPLGNTQLSNGGVFVDSAVVEGETYTYHIYPFQRNEFQIGDASTEATSGSRPSLKAVVTVDPTAPPPPAAGAGSGAGGSGAGTQCSEKLIDPTKGIAQNLECLYDRSLTILLWLVILMLIIAGYVYITAAGSQDRVKLAKEILGTTLIGVALYLLLPLILQALGA